ncbi:MAG: UvrD-helicase domain-containing protein [Raoultibacter sp.]
MNMEAFTPAQRQCVEHLNGPLFISAGAGSGKTFTLQQRIAYALSPKSGPALTSIDEVLAITFMEKAAAEIKARVRSALRAEGMFDEALKVDSAWISTIHGMCSRILHENALECGLDPDFRIILDFEAGALRAEAINEVLRSETEVNSSRFADLFAEYGTKGGPNSVSVATLLESVLKSCASFEAGLDAVDLGPEMPLPSHLARELLETYESVHNLAEGKLTAKAGVKIITSAENSRAACAALQLFLESGSQDFDELMEVVRNVERIGMFGGDEEKEAAIASQQALDKMYVIANAARGRHLTESLLELTREVLVTYDRMLKERAGLDQNGLLRTTLNVLTEYPALAERYRKQFKMVMVDEFQDTDQMQVDLITKLTGLEHLCTVGDAQQSIYRFRGADVHIYNAHCARVEEFGPEALCAQLDDNFRSHGDILAFVRRICSQETVFGSNFLDLKASRRESGIYKGKTPRVDIQLTVFEGKVEEAVEAEARGIAHRLAELRKAGHRPSEMVLLLGKTTRAAVYASALRDENFECIMVGGSSFCKAEEVNVIDNLLQVLADPANTQALFSVLTGPLLQLSADDFIQLATDVTPDGRTQRRSIDRGLYEVAAGDSTLLNHAAEMFARARASLVTQSPSQVLMGILLDSGWFARLESQGVQGTAVASNILKAVRKVEELEDNPGYGLAQVARDFSAMMNAGIKDGQGSLSVENQNAVRIMTVHKSKGLEFPIVAVAAYDASKPNYARFLSTASEGSLFLQLSAGKSAYQSPVSGGYQYRNSLSGQLNDPRAASDPAEFGIALYNREVEEDAAEGKRKLYVALTRASECLIVGGIVKATKKDPLAWCAENTPLLDDIRSALLGDAYFPEEETLLEYGGSAPAHFARIYAGTEDDDSQRGDSGLLGAETCRTDTSSVVGSLRIPVLRPLEPLAYLPIKLREGVFSYSGIAPHEEHLSRQEIDDISTASARVSQNDEVSFDSVAEARRGEDDDAGFVPAVAATDFGTAFHRAAEFAVAAAPDHTGRLVMPARERLDAIARQYGVAGDVRARLDEALSRWFDSDIARRAESNASMRAEVPFFVKVDGGCASLFMEGEIDLLCLDGSGTQAFVVDYKTGGSPEESPDQLQDKHLLQATCYACAILSQGVEMIDFAFVRVEQHDAADFAQPQVVAYHFESVDRPNLEKTILAAYKKAH